MCSAPPSSGVKIRSSRLGLLIGRNGEPSDFAGVAVFLASAASDYITGRTIYVDGGFSAT
jgi:NAD(P)-dependent dehydrogenase (short-subunit alcohol dehydrogenase family)